MKNNIIQCISLDYRFNIIKFINEKGEVAVNDIINEFSHFNIKQSVVSQTLRIFRENGLVDYKGDKQKHIYYIKNKYVSDLIKIVELVMNGDKLENVSAE